MMPFFFSKTIPLLFLFHLKHWGDYSSRHQNPCFKVTAKSYNVATRTSEPRRVKTSQNSQRSKASNAVLVTWSRATRGREVLPWPWSIKFGDDYHSSRLASQEIPCLLWKPNFITLFTRTHEKTLPTSLNRTPYFLKINFNSILPSTLVLPNGFSV
jgi:hypothetical protein